MDDKARKDAQVKAYKHYRNTIARALMDYMQELTHDFANEEGETGPKVSLTCIHRAFVEASGDTNAVLISAVKSFGLSIVNEQDASPTDVNEFIMDTVGAMHDLTMTTVMPTILGDELAADTVDRLVKTKESEMREMAEAKKLRDMLQGKDTPRESVQSMIDRMMKE